MDAVHPTLFGQIKFPFVKIISQTSEKGLKKTFVQMQGSDSAGSFKNDMDTECEWIDAWDVAMWKHWDGPFGNKSADPARELPDCVGEIVFQTNIQTSCVYTLMYLF